MDEFVLEDLLKCVATTTSDAKNIKLAVQSLLEKIKNQPSTAHGLSFLDVKNHLLLQYLISLAGITCLKSNGKSIQGSQFLDQAIDMRVYLEKLRPIDQKLKYQIDKLMKIGVDENLEEKSKLEKNPLHHRANLDNLISTGKEGEELSEVDDESDVDDDDDDIVQKPAAADQPNKSDGIYRPPKVTPQFFADEPKSQEKVQDRKKMINRALIQELQEEFLETPVEIHNMGDAYAKKLSYEAKEKKRFEETYMTRLPMTKRDKHRSKSLSTMGVLGDEITDFSSKRPTSSSSSSAKKGKGKKRKSSKGGGKKSTKKFRKSH